MSVTAMGEAEVGRWRPGLGLAALVAAAFAVRCLSLPSLSSGELRLVSGDDYGHARRVLETVRDYPRVPVADAYLGHPEGAVWIWPPLFDLVAATAVRAAHGADASVEQAIQVLAWIPPLLGAAALVPLFLLARRLFGPPAAWAATVLYTVQPAAVQWSIYGHADQHVAEVLTFLLTLGATAALVQSTESGVPRARVAGLALALASAMLTWQGAIFLVPALGAVALLARHERRMGAAILLAAPVCALAAIGNPGPVTYVSFGWFQPILLAVSGLVVWLWGGSRRERAAAAVIGLAFAIFWLPVLDAARHFGFDRSPGEMRHGGYVSYPTAWLAVIAEYRPLSSDPAARTLGDLSGGALLLPIALALWGRDLWRERRAEARLWLPVVTSIVVLAMALAQKRYIYYLAPMVALGAGEVVSRMGRRTRLPLLATAVAMALLLAPSWSRWIALSKGGGAAGHDVFRTLQRLAELDPPRIDPFAAARGPAGEVEGIMAPWTLGHFITLFAQRPAVADAFGYGFLRQADLYSAPPSDDARVGELLRSLRCRYVITGDLRPVLSSYARAAGREIPVEETWSERVHRSNEKRPMPYLKLVLTSETGFPDGGEIVPLLKVFRIVEPV